MKNIILKKTFSNSIFCLLLICFSPLQAAVITQLEFVGNDKTQEYVLLQEMQSKVGTTLDIKIVHEDIQAIMDLGLFRDVDYYIYAADDFVHGHIKLVIQVKEKYYLFVLPEIRFDEVDKEIRLGVRAYWDNIAGINHSLRLNAREYGGVLGVDDIRHELIYAIPRINGSAYNLNMFTHLREAAIESSDADPQLRSETKYGFEVFRWRHLQSRSSGWYIGSGLYHEQRYNEALVDGDVSEPDFQGNFWGFRLGYKKVNEYLFNRRGKDFGYSLDTTQVLFESEQNYTKHLLFYRSYYRLKSHPMNNLNVQLQLGMSEGDYLGDREFLLGGRDLRGYEKDLYTGNAMLLMNLEYLIPFANDPAYRYGMLFDLGNSYERFSDLDLTHLHPAIGVGFRWKLPAFVNVNIRMDIGYAIDTGDSNVLINSRHLF